MRRTVPSAYEAYYKNIPHLAARRPVSTRSFARQGLAKASLGVGIREPKNKATEQLSPNLTGSTHASFLARQPLYPKSAASASSATAPSLFFRASPP